MSDLSAGELAELRELEAKATPGPWKAVASIPEEGFNCWWLMAGRLDLGTIEGPQSNEAKAASVELIATARNALPALLAAAEREAALAARVAVLTRAMELAAVRLEILTSRMRACHEETGKHELLEEAEAFCREARAALAPKEAG